MSKNAWFREYRQEHFHTAEERAVIRCNGHHDAELALWISRQYKWEWLLTLTFRFDVTKKQAEDSLREFQFRINKQLFPKGSDQYWRMFPILEKSPVSRRYHWHVLLGDISTLKLKRTIGGSEQELRHWISKKWKSLNVSGDFFRTGEKDWLKKIDGSDIVYVCDYLIKQQNKENEPFSPNLISI